MEALRKVFLNPNVLERFYDAWRPIAFLEECRNEFGSDIVPSSPNDALDYLLDAAIDRFGYSARDVFGAVFDYQAMTQLHQVTFFTQKQLQDAVIALISNQGANETISHLILTMSPVEQGPLRSVRWKVDFKSEWVARNVIQNLRETEDIEVRRQLSLLQGIPGGQSFAGRLLRLEPVAHHFIANAEGSRPLTIMKFNNADPPNFIFDR